jgi:putative ABC transport system ATP-binding protein
MVTHDPVAAGYADTAIFLADGGLSDRLEAPTARTVLDHMSALDTEADLPGRAR